MRQLFVMHNAPCKFALVYKPHTVKVHGQICSKLYKCKYMGPTEYSGANLHVRSRTLMEASVLSQTLHRAVAFAIAPGMTVAQKLHPKCSVWPGDIMNASFLFHFLKYKKYVDSTIRFSRNSGNYGQVTEERSRTEQTAPESFGSEMQWKNS